MNKIININSLQLLLCVAAFLIPVFPRYATPVLILTFINWLLLGDLSNRVKNIKKNAMGFLMIAFYFIHIIGLIHTSNFVAAQHHILVKTAFLLFPIVLLTIQVDRKLLKRISTYFVLGCVSSALICLSYASYRYFFVSQKISHFYYNNLTFLIHPSYIAVYFNFALIILALYSFIEWRKLSFNYKLVRIVITLLLLGFVLLTSSKIGILMLVFLCAFLAVIFIVRQKKVWVGVGALSIALVSIVTMVSFFPNTLTRFQVAATQLFSGEVNTNKKESTNDRILVYHSCIDLVKENFWLGTGTGDVRDELSKIYKEKNYKTLIDSDLDAHNQFLQTFAALGIFGFLLLLGIFISGFYYAIKAKNFLLLFIVFSFFFLCLVESSFEVEAGVLFFSFFGLLLLSHNINTNSLSK